jgi:hypothetical protein
MLSLVWALPVAAQDRVIPDGRDVPALLEAWQSTVVRIQQMTGPAVVSVKTESQEKRGAQTG